MRTWSFIKCKSKAEAYARIQALEILLVVCFPFLFITYFPQTLKLQIQKNFSLALENCYNNLEISLLLLEQN